MESESRTIWHAIPTTLDPEASPNTAQGHNLMANAARRVWSELYIWKRPAVEEVRGGREGREGVVRALHLETSCRGGGEGREGGREGVVRALHLETSCRGGGEGREEGGRVWSELYIWKRPAVEEVR